MLLLWVKSVCRIVFIVTSSHFTFSYLQISKLLTCSTFLPPGHFNHETALTRAGGPGAMSDSWLARQGLQWHGCMPEQGGYSLGNWGQPAGQGSQDTSDSSGLRSERMSRQGQGQSETGVGTGTTTLTCSRCRSWACVQSPPCRGGIRRNSLTASSQQPDLRSHSWSTPELTSNTGS